MSDRMKHWKTIHTAPVDGKTILIWAKSGGVYLAYWGEIDGVWGWCDPSGGFAIEADSPNIIGWLLPPEVNYGLPKQ